MDSTVARLASWMREHHPRVGELAPGCTDAAITELEHELDVPFPDGLRALYRWTGSGDDPAVVSPAVMNDRHVLPLAQIAKVRAMMAGLVDDGTFASKDSWHKPWLPFLANPEGSYLCWDPKGSFPRVGGSPG